MLPLPGRGRRTGLDPARGDSPRREDAEARSLRPALCFARRWFSRSNKSRKEAVSTPSATAPSALPTEPPYPTRPPLPCSSLAALPQELRPIRVGATRNIITNTIASTIASTIQESPAPAASSRSEHVSMPVAVAVAVAVPTPEQALATAPSPSPAPTSAPTTAPATPSPSQPTPPIPVPTVDLAGNDVRCLDLSDRPSSANPPLSATRLYVEPQAHLLPVDQISVDGFDRNDRFSDAGYQSGDMMSVTTSLRSSVRQYLYENGHRYHSFREGLYNFPNDDPEQDRELLKHELMRLVLNGRLHLAPIGPTHGEILDLGTGTGLWAIEMGDRYPGANILGTDLSPIQPGFVPPNVKFVVDDMESRWWFRENQFDYIHSRHIVMGVKDWPGLFQQAMRHLRPGGWIEVQEVHHLPVSELADLKENPAAEYWRLIHSGLRAMGIELDNAADGRISNLLRQAGFETVTQRSFPVPIGAWPQKECLRTIGIFWREVLIEGCEAIAIGPLTRGLDWSREEVKELFEAVRDAYMDETSFMLMRLHITYARKPKP